ncbi:aldo/keto reductase [Olivibacter domesticus]|uniref:Predicted oxidoreductase n=1 Tax=Olivibacter domesticus TaxID=407022 RepID=A0A1H7HX65_OLID1|nr:aldo/keto reductase [Olivibacter domesticus]SEK54871.1 Predicted oxidoreductase [Olivibacter domesticus]
MANKRKLGLSDLEVSPITFGGNVFGWTLNEQESFNILDALIDNGFNFIDTADVYSKWVPGNKGGESETIIGNWLAKRGKRDDVIIATKLGAEMSENKKGLKAAYVKSAIETSLQRLKTDYVDLYQTHYDDEDTPVGETIQALNDLIKEGKVRYIGASNYKAERVYESNEFARKNNLQPYISLQPLYNLFDREHFEKEYLPLVQDENLAVLNYYALASGFLSGKYRSESDLNKSPRGEGIKKYLNDRGYRILTVMDEIAANKNIAPAQIAIAWLLHKPFITAPIASATNQKQLDDLLKATEIKLSDEEVRLLDRASEW